MKEVLAMNKSDDCNYTIIDRTEIVEAVFGRVFSVLGNLPKYYEEAEKEIKESDKRKRWEEQHEWDARTRTTAAMRAKAVNGMTVNSDGVFVYVGSLEKLPRFLYEEIEENDS